MESLSHARPPQKLVSFIYSLTRALFSKGVLRRTNVLPFAVLTMLLLPWNAGAFAEYERRDRLADELRSRVASAWFELLYDIVKAEQTPPPQASRIYGITAAALYEAILTGTSEHRSLVGQLNGLVVVPQPDKNKRYH